MSSTTSKTIWLDFIKKNWLIYSIGMVMMCLTSALQVLSTRSLGWVIDFFLKKTTPSWLSLQHPETIFYVLFGIILGSRILLIGARVGWRLTLARQTHNAAGMMKERLWDKVRFFPRKELEKKYSKGVLMNISTSDVGMARFIFGFTLVGLTDVIFLGFFTLFALFSIEWKMTLVSMIVLVFVPIIVKKLSDTEGERFDEAQDKLSEFNDISSQVVSSIRLQRLTQTGPFWEKRLADSAENYRLKHLVAVFTSLRYIPVMGAASILTYVIIFGLGIVAVLTEQISVGDFVAMQSLIFLLEQPLMGLGFVISDIKKSFTSLSRLYEVYETSPDAGLVNKGPAPVIQDTVIEVQNLNFRYDGSEQDIFENFSLSIVKKERLGIMGPIGSGKSTLLQILSGLERNIKGDVLFCGKIFSEYSHVDLRQFIAVVPQKPFLFADTIRNNLCLERSFSDLELWHFLDVAGLKSDVENFPHKLETQLGEWGINLSGGQKQRMTLARAIARKPQVLFLDDCLSAVDTVTEDKILRAMDVELSETTLVWVAHRKSTLKYCDRIIEL